MNRFQFDLAYMVVDAEQCPFKLLNAVAGLAEELSQLIGRQSGLMAEWWAPGTERSNLTSEFAVNLFDLAQQARRPAVQADDLGLAVGTFGHRKDGFIDRAAGNRQFLLDTPEQFERHKSKISYV